MRHDKHMFRVKGRTKMGWQYVMRCDCGKFFYPSIHKFGATRSTPAPKPSNRKKVTR